MPLKYLIRIYGVVKGRMYFIVEFILKQGKIPVMLDVIKGNPYHKDRDVKFN